ERLAEEVLGCQQTLAIYLGLNQRLKVVGGGSKPHHPVAGVENFAVGGDQRSVLRASQVEHRRPGFVAGGQFDAGQPLFALDVNVVAPNDRAASLVGQAAVVPDFLGAVGS